MSKRAAIVLAAGQGTRMRSTRAKVLHEVLGRPMVGWVLDAALEAGVDALVPVVGHQAEDVEAWIRAAYPDTALAFCLQAQQLGTGDAVRVALEATSAAETVLILCGDTPALDPTEISALLTDHDAAQRDLTVASFYADDPTGYGRIVRDDDDQVVRITEERDATDLERLIEEVNAGIYVVARGLLGDAIAKLDPQNAQGELYLTDIVASLASEGRSVDAYVLDDPDRAMGVNTRAQLVEAEWLLSSQTLTDLLDSGVVVQDPTSVRVEHGVSVGPDTVLASGVQLLGETTVGSGCQIETGCILRDTTVGDSVHIKPYVVSERAILADGAVAGPFTHLRPESVLGTGARVGNFVEMKKTQLGAGSKANHLSYLGDCSIGEGVNVGAGTITCNYDGTNKHKTVLEDGVFIGSDTQLVAPVTVGARATVAAGTTVTQDVPPGALALSRTHQVNREGYDEAYRKPREDAGKKGTS
jgi:bifunctional UDP-N-acetylglucosamine pyrophosphorylase / glucosamine-1-phosphate N-acetyltransferase